MVDFCYILVMSHFKIDMPKKQSPRDYYGDDVFKRMEESSPSFTDEEMDELYRKCIDYNAELFSAYPNQKPMDYTHYKDATAKYSGKDKCFSCGKPGARWEGGDCRFWCGMCEDCVGLKSKYLHALLYGYFNDLVNPKK